MTGAGRLRVPRPNDFIATLPTVYLYFQRRLWGRQIELSSDRTQSEADLAQKAWQSVQCSLTLSDYPNRPRLLAVLSVPPRRLLAQRDGRSCSHRPDPKLGPDQQRSEIAIELADLDAWLFGTLDVAKPLVRVPPVEVFEAQPA